MALVERLTADGIFVQEHSMEARQIEAALRQIDDRLLLWPPDGMTPYWQVYSRVSDWQPAVPVAAWMDEYGNPLPLSSGLIDKVNRMRLDAPNKGLSIDEHNARLDERNARDAEARTQAVLDEHRPYVERGRTSVGMGARTKKREWQRRSLPSRSDD